MDLSEVIRMLRFDRGMTQQELCRRAGHDESHLSKVERGHHGLSVYTAMDLLDALDADLVVKDRESDLEWRLG